MYKVKEEITVPLDSIENQDNSAVNHVPFCPRKLVKVIWNEAMFGYANSLEHGLLPETTTALYGCDSINDTESQNAFHRAGDNAEDKGLGVVLVPRLYVEGKRGWNWMLD